jgi:hypothetical protein
MPKLYWMKTSEAFPDNSWLKTQFTCFDEGKPDRESDSRWDTYISNVHQVPNGPDGGLRMWSITVSLPGPMFSFPRSGKEAGRRLVECYERMLKFYGRL